MDFIHTINAFDYHVSQMRFMIIFINQIKNLVVKKIHLAIFQSILTGQNFDTCWFYSLRCISVSHIK